MNNTLAQEFPVVIVGAGPTGTTAATLLAQYGVRCLLLDRWRAVYPQPRAVHLDDEIYRLLARLGVARQFAEISRPARGMQLLDPDMRVLAEFERDPAGGVHGFPQANMFDQPELESVLRDNLSRHPRVTLRGGAEVTSVSQVGCDRVHVRFTDRDTGADHTVEAAYVLGCDGANSIVRSAIGTTMDDLRFAQRWLVVDVATDADLGQWDGIQQVCDPDRAATFMRIGRDRYRWEFRLHAVESAANYTTLESLRPLMAPWVGHLPAGELKLVRAAEYTFRAQVAHRWRDRAVFILGDAAHLTPPFIGQGMGAGLRDAANLSWKLAGVLAGGLPDRVLDTYEVERKSHARKMIGIALAVGWAMTAGGRTGSAVRGAALPHLHRLPGVRSGILQGSTPALRNSALVTKSHRLGQLAGMLLPNLTVSPGVRMDDILGAGFALVTSQPPGPWQSRALRERGTAVILAIPDSELARWLRRGHATAAVIRPDRTVMQAGHRPSKLCAAIPRFPVTSDVPITDHRENRCHPANPKEDLDEDTFGAKPRQSR